MANRTIRVATDVGGTFTDPKHPYTRRLIGAVPVVTAAEAELRARLMDKSLMEKSNASA